MPASLNLDTPVGIVSLTEDQGAITSVSWKPVSQPDETPLLLEARDQVKAYFAGQLTQFDLPLNPKGSAFHQSVFQAMSDIPYGATRTYGDIATALNTYGQPVGQACGSNPIPIIIPCHRVLSSTGLGGYSGHGGTETKIALLKLEGGYPFLL